MRRATLFGNWVADRAMQWIAGRPVPDTQSGFSVYPIAVSHYRPWVDTLRIIRMVLRILLVGDSGS